MRRSQCHRCYHIYLAPGARLSSQFVIMFMCPPTARALWPPILHVPCALLLLLPCGLVLLVPIRALTHHYSSVPKLRDTCLSRPNRSLP